MKYLASAVALLLVVSLFLVPTDASAAPPLHPTPQESATCNAIFLAIFPLGGGNTWVVGVTGATGPWYMIHGATQGGGSYKGCPLVPTPTFILGPYSGDIDVTFQATHAQMAGWWQIVSETQTSNAEHVN